jgi:hypothetical protein
MDSPWVMGHASLELGTWGGFGGAGKEVALRGRTARCQSTAIAR